MGPHGVGASVWLLDWKLVDAASAQVGVLDSVHATHVPPQPSAVPALVHEHCDSAIPVLKSWFIITRPSVVHAKPQLA